MATKRDASGSGVGRRVPPGGKGRGGKKVRKVKSPRGEPGAKPSNHGGAEPKGGGISTSIVAPSAGGSNVERALALAREGKPVFPCRPDKRPYVSRGFKAATTDEAKIRKWWEVWPDALIGVPTGAVSGINVLDLDLKDGTIEERLASLPAAPPATRVHVTRSGGRHYLFAADAPVKSRANLLPGVDTRGDGGYIIWWPAHGCGVEERKVAKTPAWVAEMAPAPREKPAAKPAVSATVVAIGWPSARREIARDLETLDPDLGHDAWYKIGMAIHHESGGAEEGLAMWDAWSAKGKKYKPGECASRWRSFATTRPDTILWSGAIRAARSDPGASESPPGASSGPPKGLALASELYDMDFPPPRLVLDGSIKLTTGAWLLAGKPKDGKTWLAMNLACAVLTGRSYVGCQPEDQTPGLVVYMSLDDDSQARFMRRLAWMNVSKDEMRGLLVATQVDSDHYESALDMARTLLTTYPGVRMMVIDTLGSFRSRDRKDGVYQQEYDELKAINSLAHEHNVLILIVHHFRKGAVDPLTPFESISGTLGLQGGVDGMIVLSRNDYSHPTDSALDERQAALWFRGRDVEEGNLGMRLHDGQWRVIGGADDVLMGGTMKEALAVLRAEPERWFTSREVAAEIEGAKWETVRKALQRAVKRGLVLSSQGNKGGFKIKR